jgi:uncharacterized RDD family membrane protein YckC
MNQTAFPENPYAAPAAVVADEPAQDRELANRGTRLAATMLDGIIVGVAVMLGFLPSMIFRDSSDAGSWSMTLILLIVVGLAVVNAVLLARNGQTIGKYLLKIRVARPDGSNPGLGRIFVARYLPVTLMGLVPFVGGVVTLVDALLIFRDDRRCLHDQIADTIVVRA